MMDQSDLNILARGNNAARALLYKLPEIDLVVEIKYILDIQGEMLMKFLFKGKLDPQETQEYLEICEKIIKESVRIWE